MQRNMQANATGPDTAPATDFSRRLTQAARLKARNGIFGQPASQTDIRSLHRMLRERITGELADDDVAVAVQTASPHSIWSLYSQQGLEGGIAFLPLNALGVYRLVYGKLDPANPGIDCLAVGSERPAVLYVWAIVSRPRGLPGLADVMHQLDAQRFRNVDIWARPVTPRGMRMAERLGMARVSHGDAVFYKLARCVT